MAASIAKFAPTAIVFAAVGYCCWPYLDEQRPTAANRESPKLPEIASGQLAPKIVPSTDRDPFGLTMASKSPDEANTDKAKTKVGNAAPEKSKTLALSPGKSNVSDAIAHQALELAKLQNLKIDTSGLTLNATFVRGDRRVAAINGKFYSEGDALVQTDSHTKAPIIAKILPRKVLLERQGQQAELYYSHLKSKPDTPPIIPQLTLPAAITSFFTPQAVGSAKDRATTDLFQPLEALQKLLPRPARVR